MSVPGSDPTPVADSRGHGQDGVVTRGSP